MRNLKEMTAKELLHRLCWAEMELGAIIAKNPMCVVNESADYLEASAKATHLRAELSLRIEGLA